MHDFFSIKIVEGFAVAVALAQHRQPAQARLRAFQAQHFEQLAIVADRHSPLSIVVGDVQRIRRAPGAAQLAVGMPLYLELSTLDAARHDRNQCALAAMTSISTRAPGAASAAT